MKKCPFCAEEVHEKALVCKHCCRDLNKRGSGYGKVVKLDSPRHTVFVPVAVIVLIVIFVGWLLTNFKEEIIQTIRSSGQ